MDLAVSLEIDGCWYTFTLSMQASIFNCFIALLAWEMLVVLLLDRPAFILWPR